MRKLMIDPFQLTRTDVITKYSLLLNIFQYAMHGTVTHEAFIAEMTKAYGCGKLSELHTTGSHLNEHFTWLYEGDEPMAPLFSASVKQLDLTIFVYPHAYVALVESSTTKTILLTRLD